MEPCLGGADDLIGCIPKQEKTGNLFEATHTCACVTRTPLLSPEVWPMVQEEIRNRKTALNPVSADSLVKLQTHLTLSSK